jgi:toxin FitB
MNGAAVVCDTDAASFIVKDDPVRATRYKALLQGRSVVLPFPVLAELRLAAELRGWGVARRSRLDEFVADCVVRYPDSALCDAWASLVPTARRGGRQIGQHDAWIAATALQINAPLVTRNAGHFRHIADLTVLTEPDTR